jgi:ADP-ribosylglycohydrolase
MIRSLKNSVLGALVADAVAMPVHWYYDRHALDRDYGPLTGFTAPRNPHPDSILWRSSYEPGSPDADILHDQKAYWGKRDIHYHQFLKAGDNTINYRLGMELYRLVTGEGRYEPEAWLQTYIRLMRTPGWHQDTYLEEYHRAFFSRLAAGRQPAGCGIDDLHIGGLVPVPFLLAALAAVGESPERIDPSVIARHVALTHKHQKATEAASVLAKLLIAIAGGTSVREAINTYATGYAGQRTFMKWVDKCDRHVVGSTLSTACYLPESFTASLHFVWKYHDNFEKAILANATCGGDNCHRAVVVGSLLAAAHGVPESWVAGLRLYDGRFFGVGS